MAAMRRIRFSLFDLFVITLGVAAGLGYHRFPGVRWADAVLVSCTAWVIVGMVQQMRTAWLAWRDLPGDDRQLRSGAMLAVLRPLVVVAMIAAAIGFEAA